MSDLIDRLSLYLVPGLGSRSWQKLLSVYNEPSRALGAPLDELKRHLPGVDKKVLEAIHHRKSREAAEVELEKASRADISIIPLGDPLYPEYLGQIFDPPPILYLKGDPSLLNTEGIGVVGARRASVYGQRIAADLAKRLSLSDLTIISGMALGIDTSAHEGALNGSGQTIAVLGCGVDVVYPGQNRRLYEKIAERGAVISEYPLGTKPEPFRFPARNRIISGMSLGVMVVEAARKSGSLITAEYALEHGREVFAVPGRIDSRNSEGTHRLVKEGAKLVHTVSDILEELSFGKESVDGTDQNEFIPSSMSEDRRSPAGLSPEEERLFSLLDVYPQSFEEIIGKSGLTAARLNELLLILELKEIVEILPGKMIQRLTV